MSWFTSIRDSVESAVSVAGNYVAPGSSLLTGRLVSKGSQSQINSTVGKVLQVGAGAAGLGIGSSYTGIAPSAVGTAEMNGLKSISGSVVSGAKAAGAFIGGTVAGAAKGISQGIASGGGASPGSPGAAPSSGGTNYGRAANSINPNATPIVLQTANAPSGSSNTPLVLGGLALVALKVAHVL